MAAGTFYFEVKESSHGSTFVVAPQQVDALRVADLQDQDERHHLDAKLAPVHIVAQEEVMRIGWAAELLEDIDEIEELSVDVAHNHEWVGQLEHGGFLLCIADNLQRICDDYRITFFMVSRPRPPFCFNSYIASRILYF